MASSPSVSRITPASSDAAKSIVSPGAAAAMASRSETSPSSMLPSDSSTSVSTVSPHPDRLMAQSMLSPLSNGPPLESTMPEPGEISFNV